MKKIIPLFLILFWSCEGQNPLIYQFNQPYNFSSLKPGIFIQAEKRAKEKCEQVIRELSELENETFLFMFDQLNNEVEHVWSPAGLIAMVHPDKAIRDEALMVSQNMEIYLKQLDLRDDLYTATKKFSESKYAQSLKGERKRFLEDRMGKFKRAGFGLPPEKQDKVKTIQASLIRMNTQFDKNIMDHLDTLFVTEAEMEGLPDDYKNARRTPDGRYAIDMSYPSVRPFMRLSNSDAARQALNHKFLNRGFPINIALLDSLVILRHEMATQLGYKSFAEYRTEDRMAKNPENVWKFENDLKDNLRPKGREDLEKLLGLKSRRLKTKAKSILPSEKYFYTEQLLLESYQLNNELIREYFPMDGVIQGLFTIYQHLFGIRFSEVSDPDVWHPDVRMFQVIDEENALLLGRFYLDLFPRRNKYNHAAAFSITLGKQTPQGYQQPASALVCNFPRPAGDKPSLMTHDDVETFFHEFGHLLHALLTEVEFSVFSGNTPRDFIEAPSQMLENWVWQKESLKLFARHYETGDVIPDDLLEKMIAAKLMNAGVNNLQQVYYGTLDFTLHDGWLPSQNETTTDVSARLQNAITFYPYEMDTHFQAGFGHLAGYEASYYGYLWSKVFAQDIFSLFEEKGILDQVTGRRYRNIILAKGGSGDPYVLVSEFLGRKPDQKAFMKSLGLTQN